jgi:hypothetical protein
MIVKEAPLLQNRADVRHSPAVSGDLRARDGTMIHPPCNTTAGQDAGALSVAMSMRSVLRGYLTSG